MSEPTTKVTIAAAAPMPTWRSPENRTPRPVRRLTPAPTRNSATRLRAIEATKAAARWEEIRQDGDERPDREGEERAAGRPERRAELVRVQAELLADQLVEGALRVLEQAVGDRLRLVVLEPLRPIEGGHLGLFLLGHRLHLGPLEGDLALEQLPLALHRDVLARGHAEGAREEPRDACQQDERAVLAGRPPPRP